MCLIAGISQPPGIAFPQPSANTDTHAHNLPPPFGNTLNHPLGQRHCFLKSGEVEHHLSALEKHFHNTFLHCGCNSAPNPRHGPRGIQLPAWQKALAGQAGGMGCHSQPPAGPAPGPSPWHTAGCCTTSALHQQLGCTIIQTQEGSDSRVSRGGRNQQHRHLLVSHSLRQQNRWGQLSEGTGGQAILTPRAPKEKQSCAPQHPKDRQLAFP